MVVTATEFKTNFGQYLERVSEEDIFITKNGKAIGRFTSTAFDKLNALENITGIISEKNFPSDYKDARLSKL